MSQENSLSWNSRRVLEENTSTISHRVFEGNAYRPSAQNVYLQSSAFLGTLNAAFFLPKEICDVYVHCHDDVVRGRPPP